MPTTARARWMLNDGDAAIEAAVEAARAAPDADVGDMLSDVYSPRADRPLDKVEG